MAETPADVRRDIELTRERISSTLMQLEAKTNLMQVVKDHPWPALAVAVGAGVLLSGSRADVKAAGATLVATRGASSKVGTLLDDVVSNLMGGVSLAFQQRIDSLVDELKGAIGAPTGNTGSTGNTDGRQQNFAGSQGASGGSMGGNSYADRSSGSSGSSGMSGMSAISGSSAGSSAGASAGAGFGASQNSGMSARGSEATGTATGTWAPQSSSSDHVQGLGGTPGTTPRAD